MLASLIIPTYNRKNTLYYCVSAAIAQDYPDYEVIVVDDGSTDGTQELILKEFPQVRYVRQEHNRGPAAARNQGINLAKGEVILFTDDDCLLPTNFISTIIDGYLRYPQVVGVGGYLEAPDNLLRVNPFARYESIVSRQVYKVGALEYLGGFECPAGGTNSMSYRKAVLLEVGGFDETFPYAAGEDADLKWRVVQRGYQLLYVPVKVVHLQPYTFRYFWRQHQRYGWGVVYFERKHRRRPTSTARLVLRFGACWPRWLLAILRFGPTLATVKLMADLANWYGQWQATARGRRIL